MNEYRELSLDRRSLVARGAVGVAAGSLAGIYAGRALAAFDCSDVDSPTTVTSVAITAEGLANVFLAEAVRHLAGTPAAKYTPIVQAAGAAHWEHFRFLRDTVKAEPETLRYWIPDALFGSNAENVFPTLEQVASIFANAYLVGTTAFATAARTNTIYVDYARIAAEIACHASEVRAVAGVAQGDAVPNNRAYATYPLKTMGAVVAKVESFGVGFGKQGSGAPGRFYAFDGRKSPLFSTVTVDSPS